MSVGHVVRVYGRRVYKYRIHYRFHYLCARAKPSHYIWRSLFHVSQHLREKHVGNAIPGEQVSLQVSDTDREIEQSLRGG